VVYADTRPPLSDGRSARPLAARDDFPAAHGGHEPAAQLRSGTLRGPRRRPPAQGRGRRQCTTNGRAPRHSLARRTPAQILILTNVTLLRKGVIPQHKRTRSWHNGRDPGRHRHTARRHCGASIYLARPACPPANAGHGPRHDTRKRHPDTARAAPLSNLIRPAGEAALQSTKRTRTAPRNSHADAPLARRTRS
jgi:hypothetical protein